MCIVSMVPVAGFRVSGNGSLCPQWDGEMADETEQSMPTKCFPVGGKEYLSSVRRGALKWLLIVPEICLVLAWALGLLPYLRWYTIFSPVGLYIGFIPMYLHVICRRVCISQAGIEHVGWSKTGWQNIEEIAVMNVPSRFCGREFRSVVVKYSRLRRKEAMTMEPDDMDEVIDWIRCCIPPGSGTTFRIENQPTE